MNLQSVYAEESLIPDGLLRSLYTQDETTGAMKLTGLYTDQDIKGLKNTVLATRQERDSAQERLRALEEEKKQLQNDLQTLQAQILEKETHFQKQQEDFQVQKINYAIERAAMVLRLPPDGLPSFLEWGKEALLLHDNGEVTTPEGLSVETWLKKRYETLLSILGVSYGSGSMTMTPSTGNPQADVQISAIEAQETQKYLQAQREAQKRGGRVIVR